MLPKSDLERIRHYADDTFRLVSPCLGVGCYNVDVLSIYDIQLQHQQCQHL